MLRHLGLLLSVALAVAGRPMPSRRGSSYAGAMYTTTNDLQKNQVVASYIMPDGSLQAVAAYDTNGTGMCTHSSSVVGSSHRFVSLSHFAGGPLAPHGATFFSSGSLQVYGNYLFVPNAGSDTISSFRISPDDPTDLTLMQVMPTSYQVPISIAVHPDGGQVCALGGGASNGIRCWSFVEGNLTLQTQNDRTIGQNISTPLYGPINGTLSQLSFSPDGSALVMAAKGFTPPAPTGFYSVYLVQDYNLATDAVKTAVPSPGGNPFSITWDLFQSMSFVSADVSGGVDLCTLNTTTGNATCTAQLLNGTKADCWSVQSPSSGLFYIIDTAQALIFGTKVDFSSNASVVTNSSVAAGSVLPTDAVLITLENGEYFYAVDDTSLAGFAISSSNYTLASVGSLDMITASVKGLANTSAIILEGLAPYLMPPTS